MGKVLYPCVLRRRAPSARLAARFGVEEPPISREQKTLWESKFWQYTGQAVGIVIGCTLGCCPLLWLDLERGDRLKREKEQCVIFQSVVDKAWVCGMCPCKGQGWWAFRERVP